MEAGAIGFGTSRTLNHRSSDGSPIATLTAGEDELTGIALGIAVRRQGRVAGGVRLRRRGGRVRHAAPGGGRSGRPMSFSLIQSPVRRDNYLTLLGRWRTPSPPA